jgi:small subunit ribosomal protein S8
MKDTLSDTLTRLRNSSRVKRPTVIIPSTHATKNIIAILKREGYIDEVLEIVASKTTLNSTSNGISKDAKHKTPSLPEILGARSHAPLATMSQGANTVAIDTHTSTKSYPQLHVRLKYEGKKMRPSFSHVQRISTPGVRKYAKSNSIPQVLGGLGLIVISTPQGIMTDTEARKLNLGGELLFSIW